MTVEPRNLASDEVRVRFRTLGRVGGMTDDELSEFRQGFAEHFVRDDRRRFVTMPAATFDEFIESIRVYWELGAGAPTFSLAEVIAVRGDHLVLFRSHVEFADGTSTEYLSVDEYDQQMRTKRITIFDVDDDVTALGELDRLHAPVD